MNIDSKQNVGDVKKRLFSVKPINSEGLILQVNHTILLNQKSLRFLHVSFNKSSTLLAAGDHTGNIFIVDIALNKFWRLPCNYLSAVVKFSTYGSGTDIVIGTTGGKVFLVNINTGDIEDELVGHTDTVKDISFALDRLCLTVSNQEAILWNLANNVKLQVLSVEHDCRLKLALFMPVSNNILACFEDDVITVWKYGSYEVIKQIFPSSQNKLILKSIAFTRNGRAMVLSGHSSQLAVFMLDVWTIVKLITLPDFILTVRKIEFLPHLFDGGSNRILIILAGNGIIYFYDMEQLLITSQISTNEEIIKIDCSLDGKHISCVLRSGEVNLYRVAQHVPFLNKSKVVKENPENMKNVSSFSKSNTITTVRKQIKEVLNVNKLHSILKEFGEYPDSYRLTIWTQLLELPNNFQQYNHFINHKNQPSFDNIGEDYPLENKTSLKNLRKLLQNLVTWTPFFLQVPYLPVFVFPFVKVFQNEPVLCFEAVCTIIINWCQHWFEYFPLPPLNILAIIENMLLEHNPDLLKHFIYNSITTKEYAWPLLESAFSEVLTSKEWCILWDHVLSNEPAFLLIAVVAYSILHCETLLTMKKEEITIFFRTQNVLNIKRLVTKTYWLLNNTSSHNHPKQYLNEFKKLDSRAYPAFHCLPKFSFNVESEELEDLQKEQNDAKRDELEIMQQKAVVEKYLESNVVQETQNQRIAELEKLCHNQIKEERQRLIDHRIHLVNLRKQLHQREIDALNQSREKLVSRQSKNKERLLEKMMHDLSQNRAKQDLQVAKAESDLIKHYSQLLLHKMQLDETIYGDQSLPGTNTDYQIMKQHQQKLFKELEKVYDNSFSNDHLKQLNVLTSISAMDDLILRIETELIQQMTDEASATSKKLDDKKILKLEAETRELEMEVSTLLNTLTKLKQSEIKNGLNELSTRQSRKSQIPMTHGFRKLKSVIEEARNYSNGSGGSLSDELASLNYESYPQR